VALWRLQSAAGQQGSTSAMSLSAQQGHGEAAMGGGPGVPAPAPPTPPPPTAAPSCPQSPAMEASSSAGGMDQDGVDRDGIGIDVQLARRPPILDNTTSKHVKHMANASVIS